MDSGDPETNLVKYSNFYHEGLKLQKGGQFAQAIACFDTAFEAITPNGVMTISEGRHCLTARSECYLKLGNHKKAYDDAELSLEEDPNFIKGIHAKAEALYVKGSFEYALVFYHRGHALRPELDEFTLGISKCTEGIENSVGEADQVNLDKTGDMTLFLAFEAIGTTGKPDKSKKSKSRKLKEKVTVKPSEKTVKQLLGELYSDRQYLEELLEDPAFITLEDQHKPDGSRKKSLPSFVTSGLQYLDARSEFWRQQKPIYARKKDAEKLNMRRDDTFKLPAASARPDATEGAPSQTTRDTILTKLESAHAALDDKQPEAAYRICDDVLFSLSTTVIPGHRLMEAAAHSTMGDSLYAMNRNEDAIEAYEQDLVISSENVHEDGCSRALTNLGRAHSASGNYEVAIKLLAKTERKEPLATVFKEHEIGRCYLAMKTAGLAITNSDGESDVSDPGEAAISHGKAAHAAAVAVGDNFWVVSAATLCAGAALAADDKASAKNWYETALAAAKETDSPGAISNIEDALDALAEPEVEQIEH